MDIEVLQSTNGTFFNFMALGPSPGAYSGIQQTPDTKWVPSGKLFIFRYRDTETDGNNSYVEELNDTAYVGGKVGVMHSEFSGEGTGQKMIIDYPWAKRESTTVFLRGSRASNDSDVWCLKSGIAPPGECEVFLASFCRKSSQDIWSGSDMKVFIEDWVGGPRCLETDSEVGYMKQRAAIFSNWKATVDGQEVETAAPVFYTNRGHVRGLTDARMMGDRTFYVSTGGWRYNKPY